MILSKAESQSAIPISSSILRMRSTIYKKISSQPKLAIYAHSITFYEIIGGEQAHLLTNLYPISSTTNTIDLKKYFSSPWFTMIGRITSKSYNLERSQPFQCSREIKRQLRDTDRTRRSRRIMKKCQKQQIRQNATATNTMKILKDP